MSVKLAKPPKSEAAEALPADPKTHGPITLRGGDRPPLPADVVAGMSVEELNDLGYTHDGRWLARPFDPATVAEAERIVADYDFVVEWSEEDGCYYVGCRELEQMPLGDGDTISAAIALGREGMILHVAHLLEEGRTPPLPDGWCSEDVRDRPLSISFDGEQLERLERSAKAAGFRGVSDFVRHAALEKAR